MLELFIQRESIQRMQSFFNHENIDKVVFEGFKDEEEERFMEVYKEWESKLEVKKLKM